MFDFPNSPTLGQAANGYQWDGEKWTGGAGIAAPVTENFFDVSGKASIDVAVPTWAKGVQVEGSVWPGAAAGYPALQLSFDGTTFQGGATAYNIGGAVNNAGGGAGAYVTQAPAGVPGMMLNFARDNLLAPHVFSASMNLVSAGTQLIGCHSSAGAYSNTPSGQTNAAIYTYYGTATPGQVKAIRFINISGPPAFVAPSWVRFRFFGDMAQVPTGNAIPEAPMDGLVYERENGLWVPAGVRKVSSGASGSTPTVLDIPLPAGYFAFDLLLKDLGTAANGELCMRLSVDGTTFPAAASSYTYAVNQTGHNAANVATGSVGADRIIMVPTLLNSATVQSTWKIHIPITAITANVQEVIFDGIMHSGTVVSRVTGMGMLNANPAIGSPKAIRLFMNGAGANLTPTTSWQLNGFK